MYIESGSVQLLNTEYQKFPREHVFSIFLLGDLQIYALLHVILIWYMYVFITHRTHLRIGEMHRFQKIKFTEFLIELISELVKCVDFRNFLRG